MEILTTLLAKVVLWDSLFLHDPDTASVLPNFAFIALDEETTDIFGLEVRADRQILIVRRRSWILLIATNAAGCLFLVVSDIFVHFGSFVFLNVLGACATSSVRLFALTMTGCVVALFRGERARRG